jgi:hypothetical protein
MPPDARVPHTGIFLHKAEVLSALAGNDNYLPSSLSYLPKLMQTMGESNSRVACFPFTKSIRDASQQNADHPSIP